LGFFSDVFFAGVSLATSVVPLDRSVPFATSFAAARSSPVVSVSFDVLPARAFRVLFAPSSPVFFSPEASASNSGLSVNGASFAAAVFFFRSFLFFPLPVPPFTSVVVVSVAVSVFVFVFAFAFAFAFAFVSVVTAVFFPRAAARLFPLAVVLSLVVFTPSPPSRSSTASSFGIVIVARVVPSFFTVLVLDRFFATDDADDSVVASVVVVVPVVFVSVVIGTRRRAMRSIVASTDDDG
jgi:hypothetical protein